MPSFDIESKTDLAEVDNALNNMIREMTTRYDFKGSHCSIERQDDKLVLLADDDLKLRQMHELLQGHLSRRKIDAGVLDYGEVEAAAGQSVRQNVEVQQGIERELAKRIVKDIKSSKLKVQVAVQGDTLRVTGKKRDDLQQTMSLVKGLDIELPLQFVNMRD
jgi:cyclic-di-GMP-binding protein